MEDIFKRLDLDEYIKEYRNFLAREKPLFIEGDSNIHYKFIRIGYILRNASLDYFVVV